MIRFDAVSVTLDNRDILSDVSLELREQRIGIIGLNGSGKSTFARLINGLQAPSEGSVTVDHFHTVEHGRDVRRKVGFVFQNPDNQIVYPTVVEDLGFGLKNLKLGKQETAVKITAYLEKYNLSHLENRLTHQLSGGEKQMIALIGVLIMLPDYIVLDEPTTLLDLRNRNRMMATLKELDQKIIMVTHDLDLLAGFDRVLCIHDGKVHLDGPPDEVVPVYQDLCAS